MIGKYARNTTVPVEKSKAEIEKELVRYGAEGFSSGWCGDSARIEFVVGNRRVRMDMCLPKRSDFNLTDKGRTRRQDLVGKAWEQGCRSIWRDLKLIIKAKLEAVEAGISTIDREFMPDVVLPDGKTVGEHIVPRIEEAYHGGKIAGLLPDFTK